MLEILGYFGALCIGIVLGITGGGGSILTVPILVYLIGLHPILATAYSLFIVGTTSAFGTLHNLRKKLVDPRTALKFAIPSVIGVYLSRKFIVPNIPDPIFYFSSLEFRKGTFLMILFAVVMVWASVSMLNNTNDATKAVPKDKFRTIIQLFFVGILIGLIGAGGGFLIIPALMGLAQLPIRKAIGTSLLVITINSFFGFLGDIQTISIDWPFLLFFTALSVVGIFIGLYLQKYINEKHLKKLFGLFVLAMAVFILYKEIFS